jgi:hypothetical protein
MSRTADPQGFVETWEAVSKSDTHYSLLTTPLGFSFPLFPWSLVPCLQAIFRNVKLYRYGPVIG